MCVYIFVSWSLSFWPSKNLQPNGLHDLLMGFHLQDLPHAPQQPITYQDLSRCSLATRREKLHSPILSPKTKLPNLIAVLIERHLMQILDQIALRQSAGDLQGMAGLQGLCDNVCCGMATSSASGDSSSARGSIGPVLQQSQLPKGSSTS